MEFSDSSNRLINLEIVLAVPRIDLNQSIVIIGSLYSNVKLIYS